MQAVTASLRKVTEAKPKRRAAIERAKAGSSRPATPTPAWVRRSAERPSLAAVNACLLAAIIERWDRATPRVRLAGPVRPDPSTLPSASTSRARQCVPPASIPRNSCPVMAGASGDLHHQLAEILAVQQADERGGRFDEALDNGLAAFQLAGLQQDADLTGELAHQADMVGDDEALDEQPPLHDGEHLGRTCHRLGVLVLGDRAAEGNAAEIVQPLEYGMEDLAADILEIGVDALRTELVEHRAMVVLGPVVEAGIVARFAHRPLAFGLVAGTAYHARPG